MLRETCILLKIFKELNKANSSNKVVVQNYITYYTRDKIKVLYNILILIWISAKILYKKKRLVWKIHTWMGEKVLPSPLMLLRTKILTDFKLVSAF